MTYRQTLEKFWEDMWTGKFQPIWVTLWTVVGILFLVLGGQAGPLIGFWAGWVVGFFFWGYVAHKAGVYEDV